MTATLCLVPGDLLAQECGILVHQVNARGVMGAGLAKKVRAAFPEVWEDYRSRYEAGLLHLGRVVFTPVGEELWVASLVGQESYGRQRVQTDYAALQTGLKAVRRFSRLSGLQVFVPKGLGCGLAGGDWARVSALLESTLPECVVLYLPEVGPSR